jgi:hypothetical protein
MQTSAQEYRALFQKSLTLPSGMVAVYRKLSMMDYLEIQSELPLPSNLPGEVTVQTQEQLDVVLAQTKRLARYVEISVVRGTISPPLTCKRTESGRPILADDMVHVAEMPREDFEALAAAVLANAGLTAEVAEQVESFREDTLSSTDQGARGDVSRVAEPDHAPDTGGAVSGSASDLSEGREPAESAA